MLSKVVSGHHLTVSLTICFINKDLSVEKVFVFYFWPKIDGLLLQIFFFFFFLSLLFHSAAGALFVSKLTQVL